MQRVLVGVLDAILRLVQPIMPFVAESIWQALGRGGLRTRFAESRSRATQSVVIAGWPAPREEWKDAAVERRVARMQELVHIIRNVRNQFMVDEKATVDAWIRCAEVVATDFKNMQEFILALAKVGRCEAGPEIGKPKGSVTWIQSEFEVYVDLRSAVDIKDVIGLLEKQKGQKVRQREGTQAKLNNASFVSKAPPEVVQTTARPTGGVGEADQGDRGESDRPDVNRLWRSECGSQLIVLQSAASVAKLITGAGALCLGNHD